MQPSGNSILDNYRNASNFAIAPTVRPTAAPAKSSGPGGLRGFLIDQLPTIGGALGGVAGAFVPGLGETGVSEIAGAGLGSGLGEHVRQWLLGENKGNVGEQLKNDAIQGGIGAALGGAGRLIGAGASAAKGLFQAGGKAAAEGTAAEAKAAGGNVIQRLLNKQATKGAQNAYADQVGQEFGHGGIMESSNGVPINKVLSNLQQHKIAPTVTTMSKYGNAGFAYNDVLNNAIVPKGTPVNLDLGKIVGESMKSQPGLTVPKGFAGKLVNTITDSLDPTHENISGLYHPADLLKAAQDLYKVRPGTAAEGAVYNAARKALINAAGEEGGLNAAIKSYKLPSVAEAMSQDGKLLPGASDVEHILEQTGHNPTLAQEIVDNLNKAGSIQDIQKAELPHIAANEIASSHAQAIGKALPEAAGRGYSLTGAGGMSTAYELGSLAHGNVAAALPLVAKAGINPVERLASKFGTADLEQVGPRKIPSLAGEAPSVTKPTATAAEAATSAPGGRANILQRLAGGVKDAATLSGPGLGEGTLAEQLPTLSAAAQGAGGLAKEAAGFGARMAAAPIAYPLRTTGGIIKQGAGRAVGDALTSDGQPPEQTPQLPATAGMDMAGGAPAPAAAGTGQPMYTAQQLVQDIAADPKNAATYQSIYKMLNDNSNKPTSTEASTLANGSSAIDELTSLQQAIQSGDGSVGPVSGRLRSMNPFDTQEQALKSNLEIAAQMVAKGLEGGKLSDQDIKRYRQMLPNVNDTTEVALAKIAHVRSLLENQLSDYSSLVGQSAQ